jgi:hypothetical protein
MYLNMKEFKHYCINSFFVQKLYLRFSSTYSLAKEDWSKAAFGEIDSPSKWTLEIKFDNVRYLSIPKYHVSNHLILTKKLHS